MMSPYLGLPVENWTEKTKELIRQQPLKPDVIREVAVTSWEKLWKTKIGEGETVLSLEEIDPPAIVIGYIFEKLFAKELHRRYPQEWRGMQSKDEKDIVCLENSKFSIEIKTSGQLGTKIFGNRSYGQEVENETFLKKEKSGYYITANFYKKSLTLLRFGWLEQNDWKAQKAETGQASGLDNKAYEHKLFAIAGDYLLNAPINLLKGVGKQTAKNFQDEGVITIQELLQSSSNLVNSSLRQKCDNLLNICNPNISPSSLDFDYQEKLINNVWWWVVV